MALPPTSPDNKTQAPSGTFKEERDRLRSEKEDRAAEKVADGKQKKGRGKQGEEGKEGQAHDVS